MRPAFAAHSVAAAIFGVTLLVWIAIELRQAMRRRPDATTTDRGSYSFLLLLGLGAAALAVAGLRVKGAGLGYVPAVTVAAILLIWAGIALRWWSFQALGRYFTFQIMTSPDQRVITDGPYRFLRHPSYTALLLILTGFGLSYGNLLSLAALVILPLLGFIYRIRIEEAALAAALGDRYTSYARGRKRLLPFVW